jgi:very-short-patch-repair endonuclease
MTVHYNKHMYKQTRKELRSSATMPEKKLWLYLKKRQMCGYKFRRQYGIDKFVIDFYCPQLKLAIEVDGSIHKKNDVKEHDRERQIYIESYGIIFLRISNRDVLIQIQKVLGKIRDNIRLIEMKGHTSFSSTK